MSSPTYPVRVDATLDDRLSRWLWLVKWLLAIPHYIVLALLWVAFLVLSAVALVAIVFTGRYPRGIFDFNVGVLRWSWRVAYYTYGGLGTDQYPPFSLDDKPDYPAHLEIAYPEHLSRGLVLVKWWLLAIPHYLVVAFFLGSGLYVASNSDSNPGGWNTGLIGLLVLVAAVVLLFTGRYPRSIFDLVLGMNRWVLRVAGYAALMTDEYPPFRLDLGGTDPGTGPGTGTGTGVLAMSTRTAEPAPAITPTTQSSAPQLSGPPSSHWGAGRVIAVVLASAVLLTSLGLLAGGLVLRIADGTMRDNQGYLMSSTETFGSPGYAVVSRSLQLHSGSTRVDLPQRWLGTVKVKADSRTDNGVFVGVGPTSEVAAYLSGVAHSTVTDPTDSSGDPVTTFVDGGSPAMAPADADFWVASATGPGQQTVTWDPQEGSWTLVVMNGEGTTPVSADVSIGAELPILADVAVGLLIAGGALLFLSTAVLVLAVRRSKVG